MGKIGMRVALAILLAAIGVSSFGTQAMAVEASKDEMAMAAKWVKANLGPKASAMPFSFVYDGKSSTELLKTWKSSDTTTKLDRQRTQRVITYTDPKTGLEARCVVVVYKDFPTVEWTVYFKNTSEANTPIIESIQALDVSFEGKSGGEPILHYNNGDGEGRFGPLQLLLDHGVTKTFAPRAGRPTYPDWPYYNIESAGEGIIVVLGWSGQWATKFIRDESDVLRIRGGQELTHLKLFPGEEIRTPMVILQFYKGDWVDGQNIWRRWMKAHNMPKPGGKALKPIREGCSSHLYREMYDANEENQKMLIDRYCQEKLDIDYWWMDIGWYVDPIMNGGWVVGTWEVDMKRFPGGLKAISDHARSKGIGTMVWFSPEEVYPGTMLHKKSEWLLQPPNDPAIINGVNQGLRLGGRRLLNMSNPETRQWLTDHFSKLIAEQGISIYREDFNIEPLVFWRNSDAPDRQGITEIKYIQGHLEFWDELVRRKPDLLIDNCASGGQRDDLETLRRSVPLWRSDSAFDPVTTQCQTYGMAQWLPFFGTGTASVDAYSFRSNMCPSTVSMWDVRKKDLNYDLLRKLSKDWREVSEYYLGDYYPLSNYSTDDNVWMAWQFDVPEKGEGMVQAFRRAQAADASCRLRLRGLNAKARYVVHNLDEEKTVAMTGRELIESGLSVTISDKPGAAVITYKKN